METEIFSQFVSGVSTVGFPIMICLYLIYSGQKRDEKYSATLESLRKTVENNTNTVQRLLDKITNFGN